MARLRNELIAISAAPAVMSTVITSPVTAGQPVGVLPVSRLACWLARAGVPNTLADQGPDVAESSPWERPG